MKSCLELLTGSRTHRERIGPRGPIIWLNGQSIQSHSPPVTFISRMSSAPHPHQSILSPGSGLLPTDSQLVRVRRVSYSAPRALYHSPPPTSAQGSSASVYVCAHECVHASMCVHSRACECVTLRHACMSVCALECVQTCLCM